MSGTATKRRGRPPKKGRLCLKWRQQLERKLRRREKEEREADDEAAASVAAANHAAAMAAAQKRSQPKKVDADDIEFVDEWS